MCSLPIIKLIIRCFFKPISCRSVTFVTICVLSSFVLQACNSTAIYQDKNFNPPVYFGSHVVREGETLYGIAWRYGRDFKELARHNEMSPPYVISPGQRISLELNPNVSKKYSNSSKSSARSKSNVTERKGSKELGNDVTKVKKHNKFKDIKWSWPHVGPILAKFNPGKTAKATSTINKGIDIGGGLGDSVKAAAAGEVVYAGNGLRGYGNLVIINHNERFLSAYAHNRKILVKEGQHIKRGQKIAEMGRSGSDRVKLHFEIRKDGNPVNPLKYLPSQK